MMSLEALYQDLDNALLGNNHAKFIEICKSYSTVKEKNLAQALASYLEHVVEKENGTYPLHHLVSNKNLQWILFVLSPLNAMDIFTTLMQKNNKGLTPIELCDDPSIKESLLWCLREALKKLDDDAYSESDLDLDADSDKSSISFSSYHASLLLSYATQANTEKRNNSSSKNLLQEVPQQYFKL